jgi:SAM-dependent methyltransferase
LNCADRILLFLRIAQSHGDNVKYARENPGMKFPPYHILFDAAASCHFRSYYDSGLPDAAFLVKIMREYLPDQDISVCEWGCGPARLVQHIRRIDKRIQRVIGCDYNAETIGWCKKAFPDSEFIHNELTPPLPLDDNSIDVLYCVSVFTHLSEAMHYAWTAEIMRVLRPGGLFIGTFHGLKTRSKLFPNEIDMYENGKLVVRDKVFEGSKNFVAIHSDSFVRNRLLVDFENIVQVEWPSFHQELYCATKPAQPAS